MPAKMPPTSPNQMLPATVATTAATNAPNSSWPSMATLTTPDRSPMTPASAPRISGMAAGKIEPCSRDTTFNPVAVPATDQMMNDSTRPTTVSVAHHRAASPRVSRSTPPRIASPQRTMHTGRAVNVSVPTSKVAPGSENWNDAFSVDRDPNAKTTNPTRPRTISRAPAVM